MDPKQVKPHAELRDFFELVKIKNVIRLGFVDDNDLLGLYKLASAYCQASLYEGFGLPLLEAMAAKCLVVSSNTSSLPEIYDPSTMTFDPYNEDAMYKVIATSIALNKIEKEKLVKKNFDRSKKFSFEKMASDTIAAYKYSMIG
jgi:glycosyltransferase involved in cell wall biosynthesis